jgi:hypothetical protein
LPFDTGSYPRRIESSVKMNFIIWLDSLPNIIRIVKLWRLHEWGTMREVRNVCKLSVKTVQGYRLLVM